MFCDEKMKYDKTIGHTRFTVDVTDDPQRNQLVISTTERWFGTYASYKVEWPYDSRSRLAAVLDSVIAEKDVRNGSPVRLHWFARLASYLARAPIVKSFGSVDATSTPRDDRTRTGFLAQHTSGKSLFVLEDSGAKTFYVRMPFEVLERVRQEIAEPASPPYSEPAARSPQG